MLSNSLPIRVTASLPAIRRGLFSWRNGGSSKVLKRLAYTQPKTTVHAIPVETAESVIRPAGWTSKCFITSDTGVCARCIN